jgi:hypothetical protein
LWRTRNKSAEKRPGLNDAEREFLSRFAERQFPEPPRIGEPGNILQLVKGDVQALNRFEMFQETQVSPNSAIDIELDIGPVGDQPARPRQLRRGKRRVELHDPALRFQRPERVAQALAQCRVGAQEAPIMARVARRPRSIFGLGHGLRMSPAARSA